VAAGQAVAPQALTDGLRSIVKNERFEIVTSIRGLPLGVRVELQALFGTSTLDIAEPGAEFQATAVTTNPNLPRRRLAAAGCTSNHCLVYYERGGGAGAWQLAMFHWTPEATRFLWGGTAPGGLTSMDEVRKAILSGAIKVGPTVW
jgi:hypothetical protein